MALKSTNIRLKNDWMVALCSLSMTEVVVLCGHLSSRLVAFISFNFLNSSIMQRIPCAGGSNG